MAKLLVHESGGETREFELVDPEVHIGRELDNTLRLPDPSISRHHCVVRKTASGFEVQDLQSSNGVLVNGTRVQSSPLRNGDRVTLGQIQLSFQNPEDEGATVAIKAGTVPDSPVGTVRMSAEEMAAIHGEAGAGRGTDPVKLPAAEGSPMSTSPMVSTPSAPAIPPAAPPVAPPAMPPIAPPPVPSMAPAAAPMFDGPLPEPVPVLGAYLPPIPDTATMVGPAELGDRIVAYIIDAVPFICIAFAIMIGSLIPFLGCVIWLAGLLLNLALAFYVYPLCLVRHGATPGKKMMKLRVVPEGDPKGRLDIGGAILHQLGAYFGIIQLIVVAVNNGKGLSNIFAKSDTIKVDR